MDELEKLGYKKFEYQRGLVEYRRGEGNMLRIVFMDKKNKDATIGNLLESVRLTLAEMKAAISVLEGQE